MHFSLSGDIGGQMGLFIGASVLTILEIFDYLYEVNCISGSLSFLFLTMVACRYSYLTDLKLYYACINNK